MRVLMHGGPDAVAAELGIDPKTRLGEDNADGVGGGIGPNAGSELLKTAAC